MYTEFERELTDRERRRLNEELDQIEAMHSTAHVFRGPLNMGLSAAVCYMFAAWLLIKPGHAPAEAFLAIAALALGTLFAIIAGFGAYFAVHFSRTTGDLTARRAAIEDGKATVQKVQSEFVIMIDLPSGHTMLCLFDVGEGRTFVTRNLVVEGLFRHSWPSSHFEIVRRPGKEDLLGVHCIGGKIERIMKISAGGIEKGQFFKLTDGLLDRPLREVIEEVVDEETKTWIAIELDKPDRKPVKTTENDHN